MLLLRQSDFALPLAAPERKSMEDVVRKVYAEITTRCNLACRMCPRNTWHEPLSDMPDQVYAKLIDQLCSLGTVECIQLGGFGEPTVHPHVFDFVRQAKATGLTVELLTNGAFLDRNSAELLVDLQLDRLIVSIDLIDQVDAQHSQLFHDEAELQVQERLKQLHVVKLMRRSEKPQVVVTFVASRANFDQLLKLKRRCAELAIEQIIVTNFVPHDQPYPELILYSNWLTFRRHQQTSRWHPTVDLPRMDYPMAEPLLRKLWQGGTHICIEGQTIAGGPMECRFVRDGRLAIGPNGEVSPCLPLLHRHSYYFGERRREVLPHHVGNIMKQSLADIWNSDEYRQFRQRVRQFVFSPCIECSGCDLRQTNETDCLSNPFPCCGECLWAAGVVQCL